MFREHQQFGAHAPDGTPAPRRWPARRPEGVPEPRDGDITASGNGPVRRRGGTLNSRAQQSRCDCIVIDFVALWQLKTVGAAEI